MQNQRMCSMHPNIVQLREVFLTEHHLAVAMEYADGGDLSEYIDQQYQRGVRCALHLRLKFDSPAWGKYLG